MDNEKAEKQEMNDFCLDCIHECKQLATVTVFYCPLKKTEKEMTAEDKQLTLFL